MGSAIICEENAVIDGRVITGRAPGAAFDFGLALVRVLRGGEVAKQVAAGAVYR